MAKQPLTVAIIGCGNLGTALAAGILDDPSPRNSSSAEQQKILVDRVIATVETPESRENVLSSLSKYSGRIDVGLSTESVSAMREADVILFSVKPVAYPSILALPGALEAIRGKLFISIMAGINTSKLRDAVNDDTTRIVRVMPNMAARIRQAMSLGTSVPGQLTARDEAVVGWIFSQVGDFRFAPEPTFDIASVLVGCAGALLMPAIDGLLDAAVYEGLKRPLAHQYVIKSVLGILGLLAIEGGHPAVTREMIASPGGNSIRALVELESRGVRSAYTAAIMKASARSRELSNK